MDISHNNVNVQPLNKDWYSPYVASIDVLRLDKIHPVVSGNKWFKLRHNLTACKTQGYNTILTFGGGYSNHLAATAFAAQQAGVKSIGIVRGEELQHNPSETLLACANAGMELHYVTRTQYKERYDEGWQQQLSETHNAFVIPEGGANEEGRTGAADIVNYIPHIDQYTHILLSVGTGTTLAGVRNATDTNINIIGFAPMKRGRYLNHELKQFTTEDKPYHILDDYHFGGFGKHNEELITFMNEFYDINNIPLDVVYTAKMMYGIRDMLHNNKFNKEDKLLCIHTGGLQGNSSVAHLLNY